MSHSFVGVRGLKFVTSYIITDKLRVALLRGGAWIEINHAIDGGYNLIVALLRGGAWIEIPEDKPQHPTPQVALLRGGAWIEIAT